MRTAVSKQQPCWTGTPVIRRGLTAEKRSPSVRLGFSSVAPRVRTRRPRTGRREHQLDAPQGFTSRRPLPQGHWARDEKRAQRHRKRDGQSGQWGRGTGQWHCPPAGWAETRIPFPRRRGRGRVRNDTCGAPCRSRIPSRGPPSRCGRSGSGTRGSWPVPSGRPPARS